MVPFTASETLIVESPQDCPVQKHKLIGGQRVKIHTFTALSRININLVFFFDGFIGSINMSLKSFVTVKDLFKEGRSINNKIKI